MALIDNHALLDLPDESEPAFDWGEIEAEAAMQVRPPLLLLKEAMQVRSPLLLLKEAMQVRPPLLF